MPHNKPFEEIVNNRKKVIEEIELSEKLEQIVSDMNRCEFFKTRFPNHTFGVDGTNLITTTTNKIGEEVKICIFEFSAIVEGDYSFYEHTDKPGVKYLYDHRSYLYARNVGKRLRRAVTVYLVRNLDSEYKLRYTGFKIKGYNLDYFNSKIK